METELYSITDIARTLKIPESTVRYYREHFAAYIPVVGKGRTRKYPPESIGMFAVISEKLKSGMNRADIAEELERLLAQEGKRNENRADLIAIREEIDDLRSELTGKFEEIVGSVKSHNVTDVLTLPDFKEVLEERLGDVLKEVEGLNEQFNFILGEFANVSSRLSEISKLMQAQRDRDVTNALRREKRQRWFKR